MELKDTILEQNLHWRGKKIKNEYIHRDITNAIKLRSNFIEVITGVRRSGKSTIFGILIQDFI